MEAVGRMNLPPHLAKHFQGMTDEEIRQALYVSPEEFEEEKAAMLDALATFQADRQEGTP